MNIIVWLVVGGLSGWVASMIVGINAWRGIFVNVVVGIVGAVLGGWFLSPIVGVSTLNESHFSMASVIVSLVGAAALLAIVNLIRRDAAR